MCESKQIKKLSFWPVALCSNDLSIPSDLKQLLVEDVEGRAGQSSVDGTEVFEN